MKMKYLFGVMSGLLISAILGYLVFCFMYC